MIHRFKNYIWSLAASIISLFTPGMSFALPNDIISSNDNPGGKLAWNIFGKANTVGGVIMGLLQMFLGIVGLIAVVMIVYGGFRYVTSAGDPKAVESAKSTLKNSIIGLVVIILAFVIVNVVTNLAFSNVQ